ncbi:MAG: hypothetical protein ABIH63_04730 [archaeon]
MKLVRIVMIIGASIIIGATGLYLNSKATPERNIGDYRYSIRIPATKRIDEILNPGKKVNVLYNIRVPTCKAKNVAKVMDGYEKKLGHWHFNPVAWEDRETKEIYIAGAGGGISNTYDPILVNPHSDRDISNLVEVIQDFSGRIEEACK